MKEKRVRRRGMARVAFLANEEKFRSLIEAGYPLLSIYEDHATALGIGYPQFTRYVNRYLRDAVLQLRKGAPAPANPSPAAAVPKPAPAAPSAPTAKAPKKAAPFQHDPAADPADLI